MTAAIICLSPHRQQRLRKRLGLEPATRLSEIDEELRTVEQALRTLSRRKAGLLTSYRAALKRLRFDPKSGGWLVVSDAGAEP